MAQPGGIADKKSAHEVARHRGCERPFGATYVGTVAIFLALSVSQYALYVPCVHWSWYAGTSVLLGIAVPCWLFVSLYDPVDPFCRANTQTSHANTKFCNHCSCYTTKHPRTRHCYDCGKCVPGFDHHCVYLQTCIGQHNYAAFFALISSVFLWCVLVVALDVLFLIPSTLAPFGAPLNRCREEPTMVVWYSALLGLHGLLCLGALGVVLSLLLFHCVICCKRQTTYEWLVEDIRKKRDTRSEGTKPLAMRLEELREKLAASLRLRCARVPVVAPAAHASKSATANDDVKPTQLTHAGQVAIGMDG